MNPPPATTAAEVLLGHLEPRSAKANASGPIGVGGETLDRGYSDFAAWRERVDGLGATWMRLQSGWARCEPQRGTVDTAWLETVADDLVRCGIAPWVCLCYGNPAWPQGGTAQAESPIPGPDALPGWDAHVRTVGQRLQRRVTTWEIWNEPNHSHHRTEPAAYAAFVVRTARILRAVDPASRIRFGALSGSDPAYARALLAALRELNALSLVDELTVHPYVLNPDNRWRELGGMTQLQQALREADPRLRLVQGECGCPSERSTAAMGEYDWTEEAQAEYAARLLLGDAMRGVPSSWFTIIDLNYRKGDHVGINRKGLLRVGAAREVERPKPAFAVVQRLATLTAGGLEARGAVACSDQRGGILAARRLLDGTRLLAAWRSDLVPGLVEKPSTDAGVLTTVKLPLDGFTKPVLVRIRDGAVLACSGREIELAVDGWPVVVAEETAVPLAPEP